MPLREAIRTWQHFSWPAGPATPDMPALNASCFCGLVSCTCGDLTQPHPLFGVGTPERWCRLSAEGQGFEPQRDSYSRVHLPHLCIAFSLIDNLHRVSCYQSRLNYCSISLLSTVSEPTFTCCSAFFSSLILMYIAWALELDCILQYK